MANHSSYHSVNKYNHLLARNHPRYKLKERRIGIQRPEYLLIHKLKEFKRENWEQKCRPCLILFMSCLWHDNMLIGTTSINQLLSCISTKHKLSYHLAHVLEHFEGNAVNVVVVCDTDYQPTEAHKGTLSRGGWCTHSSACPSEHSREESGVLQEEHVWSPGKHKRLNSAHGLGVTRLSQCHDNVDSLNSLWLIDVIWRQGSRSTLAQVMACCLMAPNHYLNQFWLIISKV